MIDDLCTGTTVDKTVKA